MKLYSTILPYLLLVSFAAGDMTQFDHAKIESINDSPYQGAAISVIDAYDTEKHSPAEFVAPQALLKQESRKHIWPWVFFNRFIGYCEGDKSLGSVSDKPYFRRIKGMDLYNEAGALQDFFDLWRISLRMASFLGSPGIVVDHEAYNNYKNYQVAYVAEQLGKSKEEVIRRLREIGSELHDQAQREFPDATLWFLSSSLPMPTGRFPWLTGELRSVAYIVQGILDRAKATGSRLIVVCGGEHSRFYCPGSLEDLQGWIKKRDADLQPWLDRYSHLRLGAPVAPWHDPSLKPGYMGGACKRSGLNTLKDFEPLFTQLFGHYRYVWIYAVKSNYNPFNPQVAGIYNQAIKEAVGRLIKTQ
jgi:hypothetical protein